MREISTRGMLRFHCDDDDYQRHGQILALLLFIIKHLNPWIRCFLFVPCPKIKVRFALTRVSIYVLEGDPKVNLTIILSFWRQREIGALLAPLGRFIFPKESEESHISLQRFLTSVRNDITPWYPTLLLPPYRWNECICTLLNNITSLMYAISDVSRADEVMCQVWLRKGAVRLYIIMCSETQTTNKKYKLL